MPSSDVTRLTRTEFLIWMGQRLHPDVPLYNMVLAFELEGEVDPSVFEQAFARLVASSDALRTTYRERAGTPERSVAAEPPAGLEVIDAPAGDDPRAWLRTWLESRSRRVFQLDRCLFDAVLVRLGEGVWVWYFNQHHLITDGWSTAVCYRRLAGFYSAIRSGGEAAAGGFPQFADYVAFEQAQQGTPAHGKAVAYWRDRAAQACEPSRFYGQAVAHRSARTERVVHRLGRERSQRLIAAAQRPAARALTPELSQFNVFAAALYALMHRVAGGHETLGILAPAHNRSTAAFKATVGLCIEVYPLIVTVAADETFESLLAKARGESQGFLLHARPGTSTAAQSRAHDVLLNFIPSSFGDFADLSMVSEWVHPGHGDPAHSLRLQIHDFDGAGEFVLHFDFNCDVFGAAARAAAVRHFETLLDALIEEPSQPIRAVQLMTAAEREDRVTAFNETAREFAEADVLAAFEAQVQARPKHPAIVCDGATVTYGEVERWANQFARVLHERGVGRGGVVALLLDRSPEFVAVLLGVLKLGAAYVPIDPAFPAARVQLLLADCDAQVLVSDGAHLATLPEDVGRPILDVDEKAPIRSASAAPFESSVAPDDPAYVIYTSGSTGRPKGVVVSRRALTNYALWAREQYTEGEPRDFAFFSPVAVDLTVTSIYVPLVSGGSVVVYRSEDAGHDLAVLRVFDEDVAEVVKLTPAHLSLLLERGTITSSRLKALIVGGEDLPRKLAQRVGDALGDRVAIYNEYGPTEATVGCMIHRHEDAHATGTSVPIGRPIANTRIYLLDGAMQPVPAGVLGEIWIGGAGLANGYLGAAGDAAEAFRADPFCAGERIYRSGDLGREDLVTGEVLFCGRRDDQVKIRGARVELAEVEAALARHEGVAECVVHVAERESVDLDPAEDPRWADVRHCVRCGLASNHPDAHMDEAGVCDVCREYDGYRESAEAYFRTPDDLREVMHEARRESTGEHDCVMLLSGGKDSTYALYQLVEMGFNVLVFSLDNGFISDSAKANIRRVVDDLGLELVFAETSSMNAIFAESLRNFSNVCQGCFKTIYTLSTQLAKERGIKHIVTGLSRGQIFETRLADFFRNGVSDADEIDRMIVEARKAYHRVDDVVARQMDVGIFQDDAVFEEIRFVDFYRYWHVPLEEVLRFIRDEAAWLRPADTGRSTNCLINDTGIFVHKRTRGFHNYALPYSWDVRLGHKTRDECLGELDDEIDEARVERTLREVGFDLDEARDRSRESRLVAYYVPGASAPRAGDLRAHLAEQLPAYMLPSVFVPLPAIPLTPHGKVDRAALPHPSEEDGGRDPERDVTAPRDATESALVTIWQNVLGVQPIGVHEDFLDLGGDSILNIQIVSRARSAGLRISPKQLFDHPTIAELAVVAEVDAAFGEARDDAPVEGPVELMPIQRAFLQPGVVAPHDFAQTIALRTRAALDPDVLAAALATVARQHDALRLRFEERAGAWHASIVAAADAPAPVLLRLDGSQGEIAAVVAQVEERLGAGFDLGAGSLLRAALVHRGDGDLLVLAVHHLAIDAVSWGPLLADLEAALAAGGAAVRLPPRTTSVQAWAAHLGAAGASAAVGAQREFWEGLGGGDDLPVDFAGAVGAGEFRSARTVRVALPAAATTAVLGRLRQSENVRMPELLLAALGQAVARLAGGPKAMRVDLEGHGRDPVGDAELDSSRTVGWFTAVYPVVVDCQTDPAAVLRGVRERVQSVPDGGQGHGLLRSADEGLAPAPPAPVLFNYLGRLDAAVAGSTMFQMVRELRVRRSPEAARTHALDVYAGLAGGELVVGVEFSADLHTPETVERFAADLLEAVRDYAQQDLDALVGAAPVDFPNADLSQSELDDILNEFGD